jgi:hypothetical protein
MPFFLLSRHSFLLACRFWVPSGAARFQTRSILYSICFFSLLTFWFPRRFPISCSPADFRYLLAQRPSKPGRFFLFPDSF